MKTTYYVTLYNENTVVCFRVKSLITKKSVKTLSKIIVVVIALVGLV